MPAIAYDPLHMAREEAFLHGLPPVAHKAAYHLIRALRETEDHRLEDDELRLAARFHMPLDQVRRARPWLRVKFRLEGGFWSCPLVDEMAALIEQRRRAGSVGGRHRAESERRSRAAPDAGADSRAQEKPNEINARVQAPGPGDRAPEPGPIHAPAKTPTIPTGGVKRLDESQESGITDSLTPLLLFESERTSAPIAPCGDARGAHVRGAGRRAEGAPDYRRDPPGEVPAEPTRRAPKPGTKAATAQMLPPRGRLPRTAAGGYVYPAEFLNFDRDWPAHSNDHQPQRYDAYRRARLDGANHADMLALAERYGASDPAREGGERRRFRKHLRTAVEAGGHIREEARQLSLPPGLRVIRGGTDGSAVAAPGTAAITVEGPGEWPQIAAAVQAEITPPVWERWFVGARCLGVIDGALVIETRDEPARGWIRQSYGPLLERAVRRFEPAARFVEIRAAATAAAAGAGVGEAAGRVTRGTA